MAVLVGIDEAGYGPVLGPLVVSAAVFRVPDELLPVPLWDVLSRSVCRRRAGSAGRLVINDSKKLHQGLGRYESLQRGVLAALKIIFPRRQACTLRQVLEMVDARCLEQLADYPWYVAPEQTLAVDQDDINLAAAAWRAEMNSRDIKILHLFSRPMLVGQYNNLVRAMNNKAQVLFSSICRLIAEAFALYGRENLQIVVDKQSGRSFYRPLLQRMFPDLEMKIIREDENTSSYHMYSARVAMKVHFLKKGEDRQLPIALASMAGKYVRELLMQQLNSYFRQLIPELKPTAGYYQDGTRFIRDLREGKLAKGLVPEHLLIRSR